MIINQTKRKMEKPLISIIIPTYNEEEYIKNLLNDFLNQDIKEPIEILVVDGRSEDKTRKIIKEYAKKYKNIKLLDNPKRITPHALNIGKKESKGDYFLIMGAHSRVPKDFLRKNLQAIKKAKKDVVAVGGKISSLEQKTEFGKASNYALKTFLGGGMASYRYSKRKHYTNTVPFALYNKKLVGKSQFDERFIIGQDLEFNTRLRKKGYKILFDPQITSKYYFRTTPKKLKRQMWNYGVGRMKLIQKHKEKRIIDYIPLIFVIYLILFIPLIIINKWLATPLIFLIISMIIFSAKKPKLFFSIMKVYYIIWTRFSFGEFQQCLFPKKNNYR